MPGQISGAAAGALIRLALFEDELADVERFTAREEQLVEQRTGKPFAEASPRQRFRAKARRELEDLLRLTPLPVSLADEILPVDPGQPADVQKAAKLALRLTALPKEAIAEHDLELLAGLIRRV